MSQVMEISAKNAGSLTPADIAGTPIQPSDLVLFRRASLFHLTPKNFWDFLKPELQEGQRLDRFIVQYDAAQNGFLTIDIVIVNLQSRTKTRISRRYSLADFVNPQLEKEEVLSERSYPSEPDELSRLIHNHIEEPDQELNQITLRSFHQELKDFQTLSSVEERQAIWEKANVTNQYEPEIYTNLYNAFFGRRERRKMTRQANKAAKLAAQEAQATSQAAE